MPTQASEVMRLGVDEYLRVYSRRDLLRFLTCGSVDDGKSTLMGRLLHDSETVYEDQLAAAKRDTLKHGTTGGEIDFALLADALEAEREQGITIDVAYRYFATAQRKFILADAPGHEQYTRNMATAASASDLAVILIDARKGILDQTRRHAFIASLLGIRHLVVTVNKMDLVSYSRERFEEIRTEFTAFAAKLQANDVHFIPISAVHGDNVVHRSERMAWYEGSPLLNYLETVHIAGDRNLIDLRFPVQYVMRPSADFRGYSGTIASGVVRKGQQVLVLPGMVRTRVRSILTYDGELDEAFAPMAVTLTLEDEIGVSRGDMIVPVENVPRFGSEFDAMLVWMSQTPMGDSQYLIKHTTVQAPAAVTELRYRVNVNTIHREQAATLQLNEIGRVHLETPRPLAFEPYAANRNTGAFILIDRLTNETVAGGMILDREAVDDRVGRSRAGARVPFVLAIGGAPASHTHAIAAAVGRRLKERAFGATFIDPRELAATLNADLGSDPADQREVERRTGELVRLFCRAGLIVIVSTAVVPPDDFALIRHDADPAAEPDAEAEVIIASLHARGVL